MSLISCPECKAQISSFSDICIHCGYPFAKINQLNQEKEYIIKLLMDSNDSIESIELSDELAKDKDFALNIIPKRPSLFRMFSKYIRIDKEVCLLAVSCDIRNYEFVSFLLRNDKDLLNVALDNNDSLLTILFEYNSKLFNNFEFVKKTLVKDACVYDVLPSNLKNDNELVLALINNDNVDLFDIFKRNDYSCSNLELGLKILEKSINCYAYLSNKLKNNDTIIQYLINNAGDLDEFVLINAKLLMNKEFCLKLLNKKCNRYWELSNELKNDLDVLNLVINCPDFPVYRLLKENSRIADDKELALRCIKKDKKSAKYISLRLSFDPDFNEYI